jgi:cyclopropane fatty-acyl-phospholipid synthase-like methyltransferase
MSEKLEDIFNRRAKDLNDHDPWRYGEELSRRTDEIEYVWVIRNTRNRSSLLDVGCGTGRHALVLSSLFEEVVAVDFAKENIRILNDKATDTDNISTEVCKAQDISRFDRSFGVLLGIGLVQYLTDDELVKFFADAHKLLEADGQLMLKIPTTTDDSFVFNGYSDLLKSNYYSNYRNIRDIIDASKEYFDLIKVERTFTKQNLKDGLEEIERHDTTKQNWFLFEKK